MTTKTLSSNLYDIYKKYSYEKVYFQFMLGKQYLTYFESISEKNIWKIISADRDYGRVYINDIHAYRSKYTK